MTLFGFYLSKLYPGNHWLWQHPKKHVQGNDEIWFDNAVVGPHPLDNFMRNLSEKCELSVRFTNHSFHPTVIGKLDEAVIKSNHIQAVSDETIKCCAKKVPASKKREISDILSDKLTSVNKKCKMGAELDGKQMIAKKSSTHINYYKA